jgi:hypothetical protein
MTTIMSASNSEGTYGRCDAKCHTAEHPDCDCICGGRYHGCGSSAIAQDQLTRDLLGDELTSELRNRFTAGRDQARAERIHNRRSPGRGQAALDLAGTVPA